MSKIKQRKRSGKQKGRRLVAIEGATSRLGAMNGRIELIQRLIPIGLEAVSNELQAEVIRLVGGDYL